MKRWHLALLCALACVVTAENPAPACAMMHPGEPFILTQSFPSAAADFSKDRPCDAKFDWPVRGTLIKGFGRQSFYSEPSFHAGVDINAPKGSAVKAAASGEVLFAGWLRGYGNAVIIDHGRGFSSVYAHMSSTQVKEGAPVTSGSVIGAVGNTGTADGCHLHFEIREDSIAKNPMDYLKR